MVDDYARLFTVVLTLAALVTIVVSRVWMVAEGVEQHEFFMLVLIATFGAVVLAHAQHFAAFLLGLEIMGVAVYALIAYPDKAWLPIEAGLKYLVLSSASTAILLFGFALLYAATGALGFAELGAALQQTSPLLVGTGTLMIFVGRQRSSGFRFLPAGDWFVVAPLPARQTLARPLLRRAAQTQTVISLSTQRTAPDTSGPLQSATRPCRGKRSRRRPPPP